VGPRIMFLIRRARRAGITCRMLVAIACAAATAAYPAFPLPQPLTVWSVLPCGHTEFKLVKGASQDAPAWGSFVDRRLQTGTTFLDIHTSEAHDGARQAFAAGWLEGALTAPLIWTHFGNQWTISFPSHTTAPVAPHAETEFVEQHLRWLRREVRREQPASKAVYWQHVGYLLDQLEGLTAGYNAHLPAGSPVMSAAQMLLITLIDGDMDDIVSALRHRQHNATEMPIKKHHTHCSALVQLSPSGHELFVAHANWDTYRSMLRVVKYLDMPLPNATARRMSFDSYPGALSSMTDWYRTSAGLTVTETTIDVQNPKLWPHVQPESVLVWMRGMLANRLASSGDEWTELSTRYNSGTNNNQWYDRTGDRLGGLACSARRSMPRIERGTGDGGSQGAARRV
jgi:hypothetical protein